MQKIVLVVAVLALGLAGWQTWEASRLREDLTEQEELTQELGDRVIRLSKDLAMLSGVEPPPPLARLDVPDAPPASAGDHPEPTLVARGASPEVLARAVRDLQNEVARLQAEDERLGAKVASTPARVWKRPTFVHDVDSAEKVLDLTSGQRADIERIVEYTKRDLDDIRSIPNDEGKTWKDVSEVKVTKGEGFSFSMPDFAAIQKFKNSRIPGSNETYGEAERRIRNQGKREVRDVLTPEQQKTWDDAQTDGLFGPSTGASIISFATVESSSND